MSLPEMEPVIPEFDPLTEARRYHAEAMMDYLGAPSYPARLVLNHASTGYKEALAVFHGVHVNDIAVLPEEKQLYYLEFDANMGARDNQDQRLSIRFAKSAAALGVGAFSINSLMEGELYLRPSSAIASLLLGYALWPTKQEESQQTALPQCDDLDDPFELTHKVLNTSTHFFKRKIVKDDGTEIDLPNHRRIARNKLLSKKRRFISAAIGPT